MIPNKSSKIVNQKTSDIEDSLCFNVKCPNSNPEPLVPTHRMKRWNNTPIRIIRLRKHSIVPNPVGGRCQNVYRTFGRLDMLIMFFNLVSSPLPYWLKDLYNEVAKQCLPTVRV